ncbi:GntR family transcriptional regulator [Fictibacillus sp. Mic-4]|uniref:GntR family transcriptional regulator n=1 Tax=Fictibacillus sp. Mic-4 TaxID=3132826 RepID=UPI003CF67152
MKLNNQTSVPLYSQLKQIILEDIDRGVYSPGEKMPTESELCDKYGVSRITVRKAVLDLVDDGILIRQQGKGTFVQRQKIKRELISITGYSEFMVESGKKPDTKIISLNILHASEEIADSLAIEPGDEILEMKRILFYDEMPFVFEVSTYPLTLVPNLDQYIHESISTYEILKNRYHLYPAHKTELINVISAHAEEAKYLNCEVGTPLCKIDKIAYDADRQPIHTSALYYPADRVTFTINSSIPQNP